MAKLKPGIIMPLFLIMITAIFAIGFMVSKSIPAQDNQLTRSIENRINNPAHTANIININNVSTWKVHKNPTYGYQIKYPDLWTFNSSHNTTDKDLLIRERFLDNSVDVTVSVYKTYDKPKSDKKTKIKDVTFAYYINKADHKAVVTKVDDYYYTIDLAEENYFKNSSQFNEIFILLLKNLTFTNQN